MKSIPFDKFKESDLGGIDVTHVRVATIDVNYIEFDPSSYQGVTVSIEDDNKLFNTGRFYDDYREALAYANNQANIVYALSSVSDFISDSKLKPI